MTLLLPIGLVSLLSILLLIIIYLIKANYQHKYVSSTYVWALSLKLKKKKLPVSKLRNILLFLCQVLFLTACVIAISQPALITRAAVTEREVIAVIDSSASMRTGDSGVTRFDRAVQQAGELAESVFDVGGYVSVLVAGTTPSVLAQRATSELRQNVLDSLNDLSSQDSCSYGSADIEGTLKLCENIIKENSNAELYLYTDTEYAYVPSGVNVVNVANGTEWNAGILDAYTAMEDNYYSVIVNVACYGVAREVHLTVQAQNANSEEIEGGKTITLEADVLCKDSQPVTVIFRSGNLTLEDYQLNAENVQFVSIEDKDRFYSYKSISVQLNVSDSFPQDDAFSIYEGDREVVKVLYSSPSPNNFVSGVMGAIMDKYNKDIWDIQLTEVHSDPPTEGYDLYIYEHTMPDVMPTDGIVILWDLDKAPEGSGLTLGNIKDMSSDGPGVYLTQEADDPLLTSVKAGRITVSRYTTLLSYDPAYQELLSCDTSPVLLARNDSTAKVLVLPFDIHFSSIGINIVDFSALFYNLFENWMPAIVKDHTFSVYEKVELNSRGQLLTVTNTATQDSVIEFDEFPATLSLDLPGTYTIRQTTDLGKELGINIYVKIPSEESNIWAKEDALRDPYLIESYGTTYKDLILYFAIAMVALLFFEWILYSRENL